MSNEWNNVNEETKDNSAETRSGEDKGVTEENKIVPIINKTQSAASENQVSTAEIAAQLVAQYASQPLAQVVGQPVLQAIAQASGTQMAQAADQAQAQLAFQPAGVSAEQPAVQASAQSVPEPNAQAAAQTAAQSAAATSQTAKQPTISETSDMASASNEDDEFDFDEEERPKKRFFRIRSSNDEESRDKLILSRIKDEDLMDYLALEQRRLEFLQQAKEAKEKRFLIAFQLLISLSAIVAITYLLQDNPTILISILYIVGIVAALNVWKNPHDKGRPKK